ncbi:hypothetical protein C5D36_04720 [Rathayibacter sp. AY1C6]|nr:hypothetical protein C5D36_04720 [Rathayibacter sp. AY1C6]
MEVTTLVADERASAGEERTEALQLIAEPDRLDVQPPRPRTAIVARMLSTSSTVRRGRRIRTRNAATTEGTTRASGVPSWPTVISAAIALN